MRSLSDNEKSIIDYIIEKSMENNTVKNNLVEILCFAKTIKDGVKQKDEYTNFDEKYLKYDIRNKKLWVENKLGTESKLVATSKYIVPVAETIYFLEYLGEMNFIVFLNYNADISNSTFPTKNEKKYFQEIYDEPLKNFFFQHIKSGIFATEHLKEYQKNGYKTVEQVRHEKQIGKMNGQIVWAIVVALISAVAALISKFYKC